MASTSRLKQRVAAAKRKRESSPRPEPRRLGKVSSTEFRQLTTAYCDVLYAIESAIVNCAIEDRRIDDAVTLAVIRRVILQDPPTTLPHAWLYAELAAARGRCGNLVDSDWNDCLRVVMDSVRRHSCLEEGERSYLNFVQPMVA